MGNANQETFRIPALIFMQKYLLNIYFVQILHEKITVHCVQCTGTEVLLWMLLLKNLLHQTAFLGKIRIVTSSASYLFKFVSL